MRTGKKMGMDGQIVYFSVTMPKRFKDREHERETDRELGGAGGRWPICSSELPLQAFGHVFPPCFPLKGRCSSDSTHAHITHAHQRTHACM